MFSELAGRRRKLGAPCPLRGAERPPRRVPRPGALRALRTPHRAPSHGPLSPPGSDRPRATRRGDWEPNGTRAPRVPGRGRGRWPGRGPGCRRSGWGAPPTPGGLPARRGAAGGSEGLPGPREGVRGTGRSGRRPWPETPVGATDAQRRRSGVGTAARPHLPGRCPAAESRVSLSEVELSWSTAQAALKAAASSSMRAGSQAGSGAGSGAALGAPSRAGGDERAPERGHRALGWSRSCRRRRRRRALQQAGGRAGARLEAPGVATATGEAGGARAAGARPGGSGAGEPGPGATRAHRAPTAARDLTAGSAPRSSAAGLAPPEETWRAGWVGAGALRSWSSGPLLDIWPDLARSRGELGRKGRGDPLPGSPSNPRLAHAAHPLRSFTGTGQKTPASAAPGPAPRGTLEGVRS